METQKLSVKAFTLAGGILWSIGLMTVGFLNLKFPGYGQAFLDGMGSVYLWHPQIASLESVFILGGMAFRDGATGGLFFALLYNLCSCCCKKKSE